MAPSTNMPADLLSEFRALDNELVWLSASWEVFLQLYGPDEGQLELLNQANAFFGIARQSIRNVVFVGICRLTDPASSLRGDHENLSIARLAATVKRVRGTDDPALDSLLYSAEDAAGPFRTWRNKLLAHADLDTMLNLKSDLLPVIPHERVTAALESIGGFLNHVQGSFDSTSTHYKHIIMRGDGRQVLEILRLARESRASQLEGWAKGPTGTHA